jgi:ferritin-like metal-binding protein YciE
MEEMEENEMLGIAGSCNGLEKYEIKGYKSLTKVGVR